MANLIKYAVLISLLLLVLCAEIKAQSTFSLSGDDTTSTPDIFMLPAEEYDVHGLGVTPYSQYSPNTSFQRAYNLAVEDLLSNLMTSVYIENFKMGMSSFRTRHEFAIQDTVKSGSVVPLDSAVVNDVVYYFVTHNDSITVGQNQLTPSELRVRGWDEATFEPVRIGNFWISAGAEKASSFSPYKSWTKSKLNALAILAETLQINVQSSTRSYQSNVTQISYITSKVVFQDIYVIDRKIRQDSCYTLVAVPEENILLWN